jgi:hypothetical protein
MALTPNTSDTSSIRTTRCTNPAENAPGITFKNPGSLSLEASILQSRTNSASSPSFGKRLLSMSFLQQFEASCFVQ